MAPSTPPPPASAEFAALAMASTGMRVMSPSFNTIFRPVWLVHSIVRNSQTGRPALLDYNRSMTRRELFSAAAAAGVLCASKLSAKTRIDKSRISAITDEIGLSPEEAIAFAHHYALENVEIRTR